MRRGVYPFPLPLVPGSDGAGVRRDTGEEVVILPVAALGQGARTRPGPDFQILGGPRDGTFAELIAVPAENVYPEAGAALVGGGGGVPARGADRVAGAVRSRPAVEAETVLILGAGSGVSTFAVQLAVQAGARVLVTSSSQEKIDRAIALGAEAGVLYTDDGLGRGGRGARGRPRRRSRARLGRLDVGRVAADCFAPAAAWSCSAAPAARR